ncbi:MAG: DUF3842 family protein [Firmicutes bacterium]|nr:DUF3842 family protein [Bacillota bacterium]
MQVVVIDGQGGGLGRQVVAALKDAALPPLHILAVGANSTATAAMLKAGADQAATGENAVLAAVRRADLVIGPLGIVIADALVGEISPAMAAAVGQCRAKKLLIPVNQCDTIVVGVADLSYGKLIEALVELVKRECAAADE